MKQLFLLSSIISLLGIFGPAEVKADVRMPLIFGDHMVLQQDAQIAIWGWADAVIEGNKVIVSSSEVAAPVAVRYGFSNSPRCNLYNEKELPASPFRTDNWDR